MINRLGGRKFIGFIVLVGLGLVLAARGTALDANVVALLLGAYAVFAGTNTIASRGAASQQTTPDYGDQQVAEFLNKNLMPQLNQLAQSHQQTAQGLNQLAEQFIAKQPPQRSAKETADSYRQMLQEMDQQVIK